jgi:hypothetical protein
LTVLEKGSTYTAMASQVASKVEAKPNIAMLPKLRWAAVRAEGDGGMIGSIYSDNLL